jgi:tetratricopeptide (TPR) repeat protein
MRVLNCLLVAGIGLAVSILPAQAVDDYDVCLDMIASDPSRAEREAGEWARYGGGAGARHCYALALIAIGAPSRSIDELLGIAAEEPDLEPDARADILAQAGDLLLEEGDRVTATVVAEQALRLDARNAASLALRARLKLDAGDMRAAVRDLDEALRQNPSSARFLALRASAYRRLGQHIEARDDAAFATESAPDNAMAWLERGRNEAALKDRNAARFSFLEAIDLDREGEIGKAARLALQRMEAGIEE